MSHSLTTLSSLGIPAATRTGRSVMRALTVLIQSQKYSYMGLVKVLRRRGPHDRWHRRAGVVLSKGGRGKVASRGLGVSVQCSTYLRENGVNIDFISAHQTLIYNIVTLPQRVDTSRVRPSGPASPQTDRSFFYPSTNFLFSAFVDLTLIPA